MGQAKSFVEILGEAIEKDLRAELRRELEAELKSSSGETKASQASSQTNAHTHAYFETWLAANATQSTFNSAPKAKSAYGTSKRPESPKQKTETASQTATQEKQEPAEAVITLSLMEDVCAAELLARHSGIDLSKLTESKLKNAWRKAALKTHPDRYSQADQVTQARMSTQFRSLSEAYERLMCTVRSQAAHNQAA